MMWKNCGSPPSNQSNVTMNMASYGNVEGVGSPPGDVVSLEELMSEQLARELQVLFECFFSFCFKDQQVKEYLATSY